MVYQLNHQGVDQVSLMDADAQFLLTAVPSEGRHSMQSVVVEPYMYLCVYIYIYTYMCIYL